jgi:hypothetical protein
MVAPVQKGESGWNEIRALWDEAINENPNDVAVLINAICFYSFWSFNKRRLFGNTSWSWSPKIISGIETFPGYICIARVTKTQRPISAMRKKR